VSDELLKDVVSTAHRAYRGTGGLGAARAALKDSESSGLALVIAARRLLGPTWDAYEPETLWLELGDVPLLNRDKLLAAQALIVYPAFYWDARVLGNTALALSHEAVHGRAMPAPTPEALAWAAVEAPIIFGVTNDEDVEPEYDDEAVAYVAAVLAHAGYAFTPEELEFADDHLVGLLSLDGRDLHAKVKDAPEAPKAGSSEEDPALDVQVERRAGIEAYVTHRLEALKSELAKF
jgi:hypothetical protein